MVRVLDLKLYRDLKRSRGLLIAIAGIIAVGVTCFVAMQSSYRNLNNAKLRYYQHSRMADAWIDIKKIPNADVPRLADIPGISSIQSRVQSIVTIDLESSTRPVNGQLVSLPDHRTEVLNDIEIRQGDYFGSQRENEIIVSERFARHHRLFPGQEIHVLLNQRKQSMVIVGTAVSSEFTYLLGPGAILPDPAQFGVFYVKRSFAEDAFDMKGASNQLVLRISPSHLDRIEAILDQIETEAAEYGVISTTPLSRQVSNQYLTNEINGLGAFATVLPLIFLAVAGIILNVLMSRLARQQRTVIGTIKAMGYSNLDVFVHFIKLGLVVGLIGGLAGNVLGYLAATGMTLFYQTVFEFPDLQSEVHWQTMAIGLLASLVCAALGSVGGARSALVLQVAESMRPAPPKSGGRILLEKIHWIWNFLNAQWKMSIRDIFRSPVRSLAALFASTMGAGLLMTGFMMVESQNFLIDFQFSQIVRSDMDLLLDDATTENALDDIRVLPGVDYLEPRLDVACTIYNGSFSKRTVINGIGRDAQLTRPCDADGSAIRIPATGIAIDRRLAEVLNVDVGDRVTVKPSQGSREPFQPVVQVISESFIGTSVYADRVYLSHQIQHEPILNAIQLKTNHDPDDVKALFADLKNIPGIQAIQDQNKIVEVLNDTLLKTQWISIATIVGFGGMVFFGSIFNSSMVNLAERQREVATLIAIGYSPWQIGATFFRESNLINVFGSLLGIPVGIGLMHLTANAFNSDLIRLPIVCPNWVWVSTLLFAILFGLIAHAAVQKNIHKMNYKEALQVKE